VPQALFPTERAEKPGEFNRLESCRRKSDEGDCRLPTTPRNLSVREAPHPMANFTRRNPVNLMRYMNRTAASSVAVTATLAACASHPVYHDETFAAETPFSTKVRGSGEVVCWSVKRAFLTQGYMLDRSSDAVILTGSKDLQTDDDTNETLRLQATCVDNRDGTSSVFASASHEVSKVQNVKQSVSAGVGIATVTVPAGSEKVLRPISRATIKDPMFYERFYALVQSFADQEKRAPDQEKRAR